jgi:hypothetical protein
VGLTVQPSLHAKSEAVPVIRQPLSSEGEIEGLQEKLEMATGSLNRLEEENSTLRALMGVYHARWINELCCAEALERYGLDNVPCLSQAGWLSPSPDHSYSAYLHLSHRLWTDEDIIGDEHNNICE